MDNAAQPQQHRESEPELAAEPQLPHSRRPGRTRGALGVLVARSELVAHEQKLDLAEHEVRDLRTFSQVMTAQLQIDEHRLLWAYDADGDGFGGVFLPLTTAKLKEAISEGERQKLRVRVCLDERDLTDMAADAVASMLADCKRTHLDETVTLADLPRERRNNLETMAIPDAQWAALNATFDEIDVDGSGTITVDELHTALQDRSTELSKLDMDTLWREINVGAKVLTPAIDFPGFCKFAHSPNLGVRRAAQDRARRDNYWLRHAQPAPGEDHLWVDIRFVLFKLTNVDTVGGSAFVKLSLFSYWNDPRVKGWDGPLPEKLWGPAFNLSNSLGDLIVTEDEFELLDRSTGRLKRAFIYEGKVTFTTLSRWLSNDGTAKGKSPKGKSYRVRKIQDESEGKWLRLDRFQTIPEFSLHGISSRIEEKAPNEAGSERTEITVSLHISRDANYYFMKVISPVCMLTMLSLHVYLFDPVNISDRVATTATYFLAAFAMLYVVSDSLPKTSFLTRIDKMIFLSTCNLLVAGIATAMLYVYLEHGLGFTEATTEGESEGSSVRRGAESGQVEQEGASENQTAAEIVYAARTYNAHIISVTTGYVTFFVFCLANIYWFVPLVIHQQRAIEELKADYPPIQEQARLHKRSASARLCSCCCCWLSCQRHSPTLSPAACCRGGATKSHPALSSQYSQLNRLSDKNRRRISSSSVTSVIDGPSILAACCNDDPEAAAGSVHISGESIAKKGFSQPPSFSRSVRLARTQCHEQEGSGRGLDIWWRNQELLHQWYVEQQHNFALMQLIVEHCEGLSLEDLRRYSQPQLEVIARGKKTTQQQQTEQISEAAIQAAIWLEESHELRWGTKRRDPPATLGQNFSYKAVTQDTSTGAPLYRIAENVRATATAKRGWP